MIFDVESRTFEEVKLIIYTQCYLRRCKITDHAKGGHVV